MIKAGDYATIGTNFRARVLPVNGSIFIVFTMIAYPLGPRGQNMVAVQDDVALPFRLCGVSYLLFVCWPMLN